MRKCGDCTLCCKLLPMQADSYSVERVADAAKAMCEHGLATPAEFRGMMADFTKPAGLPCPHQGLHGCKVYARRPFGCRYWNCRWLVNDDTADLRRPDRSRYVIDIMPDFIRMQKDGETEPVNVQVVQVWVDPKQPDAWREDPALLAYLDRRGKEGKAALIRANASDALVVFPPSMSSDGKWHTKAGKGSAEHRGNELFEGLARTRKVMMEIP